MGTKFFTCVALFVAVLSSVCFSYSGGLGTSGAPYEISTSADWQQLMNTSADWDKHFILTANIDLAGVTITPVGNGSIKFTGVFDGNGHVIRNLTYTTVNAVNYVGLFGYTNNATIDNLGVENANLSTGGNCIGGLAGYQRYGTINNCYTTGSVNGSTSSNWLGGLVGEQDFVTINNCYAATIVNGGSGYEFGGLVGLQIDCITSNCYAIGSVMGSITSKRLGGLVGYQESGTISNCYAIGNVTGGDYLGGLVGKQYNGQTGSAKIENCYATGSVNGYDFVGGLVGQQGNNGSSPYLLAKIQNCYATGSVTGDFYIGGLIGGSSGGVINCFWDMQTSGLANSGGGKSRTTIQMKSANNYIAWNTPAKTNWVLDNGNDYPRLAWEGSAGQPLSAQIFMDFITEGGGTVESPYKIYTAEQLNMVGLFPSFWNKAFALQNDIDLSVYTGSEFNQIGMQGTFFSGTFDGRGYTVFNFTYETGCEGNIGLFRCIGNAIIKNLGMENVTISSKVGNLGSLAGMQYLGTISNCHVTGSVTGGLYLGGLVGYQYSGTINNCYALSSVIVDSSVINSSYYFGGLVGYQDSGTINNCFASSSVIGNIYSYYLGGLVGYQGGTVSNCFATGSVTGYGYLGGLVGYQKNSTFARIEKCYAIGKMAGNVHKGGLLGYKSGSNSVLADCFWDIQSSGTTNGVGNIYPEPAGVVGKTTADMKTFSTFTLAGWDFTNIWAICEGTNYPRFQWQILSVDFDCPDGIGIEDLLYLAGRWLETTAEPFDGADVTGDRRVDVCDFTVLSENWP